MFIGRTRFLDNETGQEVSRGNGIVREIPANTTPAYDLSCSINVRVLGVTNDSLRFLVVIYRVWTSTASRVAGDTPALINSHLFAKPKANTDLREYIRSNMLSYIERASLNGWTGDQRDPRIQATTNDPSGFYGDAEVVKLRNVNLEMTLD